MSLFSEAVVWVVVVLWILRIFLVFHLQWCIQWIVLSSCSVLKALRWMQNVPRPHHWLREISMVFLKHRDKCIHSQVNPGHCWIFLRKLESLCPPETGYPLVSKATDWCWKGLGTPHIYTPPINRLQGLNHLTTCGKFNPLGLILLLSLVTTQYIDSCYLLFPAASP